MAQALDDGLIEKIQPDVEAVMVKEQMTGRGWNASWITNSMRHLASLNQFRIQLGEDRLPRQREERFLNIYR